MTPGSPISPISPCARGDDAGVTFQLPDPGSVPLERIPEVIGELERVKAVLWARMVAPKVTTADEDRLLTVDEAAERLSVTPDWLRRRPDLPFVRKLSDGVVRYDARELRRWASMRRPG